MPDPNENGTETRVQPVPPLRQQLPWLLPAWLYFPAVWFGVAPLGRNVSENVFGLIATIGGLLLLVPLVAAAKGRVSGKILTWTVTVPTIAVMIGWTMFAGD